MVKHGGPGVYSATYSNIPVYEYQFGEGLKEHVMRRRADDWINATHILKAAGFDKPARTRILEREVQKEKHEKVQGGYGKYQGTWVPLEQGEVLAQRNNVYEKLRAIFEFIPGNLSPPPAPKHTTAKPKVPKKPAIPKWGNMAAPPRVMPDDDYDNMSAQYNDEDSVADDATVASNSFMVDDNRYDMLQQSTGHRKRKREEQIADQQQREHVLYSDALLDYFLTADSYNDRAPKPEPPVNFRPDWLIDSDSHTAMHWAAAMGDIEMVKELKRFGANVAPANAHGETPLMRCVLFVNCMERQSMPTVVKELMATIDCIDNFGSTVLHHAAAMTVSKQKHHCIRYYVDIILNKMQELLPPDQIQAILDAQDVDGNTALHIAAKNRASKVVRALVGRGARTDITNKERVTAEELIQEINERRKRDRHAQGSSSPYGSDSRFYDMPEEPHSRAVHHVSEAAMSIQGRIAPLMLEKFQDLANSFDEELVEKETSEREAKRILQGAVQELESVREQIREISFEKESPEVIQQSKDRLVHVEKKVTSVIEQQQKVQLRSRVDRELSKTNGHMLTDNDDVGERVMLAKMLAEEQNKRQKIVGQYRDALSMAGAGEKGEQYRRLIAKSLGTSAGELTNDNLDVLLLSLKEDQDGGVPEAVMVDT